MSDGRMSRRNKGVKRIPTAKLPRLSRYSNQKANFRSTSHFQMKNRIVQYGRNHLSAGKNCRLNNDEFHSDTTENGSTSVIQIRGLSSVSETRSPQKGKQSLDRWKPVPRLRNEPHLEEQEETFLRSKRQLNENRAEDHPLYAVEWKSFWERREQQFKLNEKDSLSEDFMPDWMAYWNKRMNDLDLEEEMNTVEAKQFELKRKPHQDPSHLCKGNNSEYGNGSRELVGQRWSLKKSPVHKKKLDLLDSNIEKSFPQSIEPHCGIKSSLKPSPSEGFGVSLNPKRICHVMPSQIPKDAPPSSDPSLLQVLRMLVALEDSLGSLGPSITNLLTRALSAERCEIGSSSKLLKDDSTCIDLLDTSKEKLKGLLLAGILDGVKGTAASQAVEYVTRLLKHNSNTSRSCTPIDGPVGFNMASLVNNLQAAGLLHPIQLTPSLPSATGSSSVAEMKDQNSTQSANNLYRSRFEKCDRFTGEELKTLIVNFRTLTESQKCDLVQYLRQLEETFSDKDVTNPNEPCSSISTSPLSKKYGQYINGKIINPVAPDRHLSKIRFPFILKKTGLSSIDLDNFGIPLDGLDPPRPKMPLNLSCELPSCATNNEGFFPSSENHQPCPTGIIYRADQSKSQIIQSSHAHQQPGHMAAIPLRHTQYSCKTQLMHVDRIQQQQQELNAVQLQKLSFYNDKLDPRRNRLMHNGIHVAQLNRPVRDDQINSPYYQEPIVIPTSPSLATECYTINE